MHSVLQWIPLSMLLVQASQQPYKLAVTMPILQLRKLRIWGPTMLLKP